MNALDLHYLHIIGTSSTWQEAEERAALPQKDLLTCIHRLEEELHLSLLTSSKSLRLTKKAMELLPYVRTADQAMQKIYDLSMEKSSEPPTVSVCLKVCHLLMPQIYNGFHNYCPDIKLELNISLNTASHSRFTISTEKEMPKDEGCLLLMKEPISVELSSSHPLAGQNSLRLADLADEPFICHEEGTKMRELFDKCFQQAGFTPHTIFTSISTSDATAWNFISSGKAINLVPSITEELIRPKNLRLIPLTHPSMYRYIILVWDSSKPLTTAEQQVMQYLISFFHDLQNCMVSPPHQPRVFAHTFGSFDLYLNGKPIYFSNKKSKELFALMINQRGGSISMEQAIDLLWEGEPYGDNLKQRYRNAILCLRQTLQSHNLQHLVTFQRANSNINTEHLQCDLYNFLGDPKKFIHTFSGEYMTNYSWGEYTLGMLEDMTNHISE